MRKLAAVFASLLMLSFIIGTVGCDSETASKTTLTPTSTPTATPSPSPTHTPIPTPTPVPSGSLQQFYGSEAINYFFEIALGTEYGAATPILRKWTGGMRVQTHGSPTIVDLDSLSVIVKELNDLISEVSTVRLQIVDTNPNVDIYFVPESQFLSIEPNVEPGNWGFYWVWWDQSNTIIKARILIDAEKTTQKERQHLIREELTQSLGLARDSLRYPDSIFYQEWTTTTQYASIDRKVIKLLYERRLRTGMTKPEIEALLNTSITSD